MTRSELYRMVLVSKKSRDRSLVWILKHIFISIVAIFVTKVNVLYQAYLGGGYDMRIAREPLNVERCRNVGGCHRVQGNQSFPGLIRSHYNLFLHLLL